MRATLVTPWRDRREFERDYWHAIRQVDAQVIVVDDGSDTPLPNALRIPRSGFAPACNAGLHAARTDIVVFLNNDIAPLGGDWLTPLVDLIEPGVLAGADLRPAEVDGVPMPYLEGWCVGGMRDDLLDLGGWDETLAEPAYYSDNDLSLRARMAGMTLRESRETSQRLHHKRNGTAGPASTPVVMEATAKNRDLFLSRARDALTPA